MKAETEVKDRYEKLKSEFEETIDLLIDFPSDESMKRSRDRIQSEMWVLEWILNIED